MSTGIIKASIMYESEAAALSEVVYLFWINSSIQAQKFCSRVSERNVHIVTSERLARKSVGIVHVMLEPESGIFYHKIIGLASSSKNSCSGFIGIYYPHGQEVNILKDG